MREDGGGGGALPGKVVSKPSCEGQYQIGLSQTAQRKCLRGGIQPPVQKLKVKEKGQCLWNCSEGNAQEESPKQKRDLGLERCASSGGGGLFCPGFVSTPETLGSMEKN